MRLTQKAISLAVVLGVLFSSAGCSKNISGIYVRDKTKKDFIELRSDGTFILREHGSEVSGKYRVDGDVIKLTIAGETSVQAKLHDGVIVDSQSQPWIKGERPGEAASAQPAAPGDGTSPQQNESAAASSVRTLNTAEVVYLTTFPSEGYAASLAVLGAGSPPVDCSSPGKIDPKHACLIDDRLACASAWCIKSGYRFNISSPDKARPITDYTITVTPIDAGNGGKNFCSMSDAVIRMQTGPPLSSPVPVSLCRTWPPLQ